MVTTFYPPYHFGGDATYVRALSQALVARGHDVTVVHCEDAFTINGDVGAVATASEDGVRVHRLKSKLGLLSPLITQQLGIPGLKSGELRRLLAEDFDVVHFHNISLIGGPGVLALSQAPVTLYTLHEHWLLCATHIFWKNRTMPCDKRECIRCSLRSGIPPQLWRYGQHIERNLCNVDAFLAPSRYTASAHQAQLPVEHKMQVLPLFSTLTPSAPAEQTAPSGRFLYVGRMVAAKGIAELIATFSKWPQFELDVVGEGELLPDLKREYGAFQNIHFRGAVQQQALVKYYTQATALIMPSLAPETFGLTVVEAFACGTPAIVRAAGGNREAVEDSSAGLLYESEEELLSALEYFSSDKDARELLGKRAKEAYNTQYTPDLHLERYLAIVESVQQSKVNTIAVG